VKYGLNHCVALIEAKKASLVVIAHDVDPIELVVFLPALCRKMGVPYVIVKSKARLGTVVHKKTAAVLTLQDVKSEDQRDLATLVTASKANLFVYSFLWMSSILTDNNFAIARINTRSNVANGAEVFGATNPVKCFGNAQRLLVRLFRPLLSANFEIVIPTAFCLNSLLL
jgi:ribosomal protein L7Ae-like RNA K-turn-binding protein